jgi:hypothetical protein
MICYNAAMNSRTMAVIIVIIIGAFGLWLLLTRMQSVPVQGNGTTQDPVITADQGLIEMSLGQTATVGGVTITPLELVEDSRCPSDVQCIQAGTVRVRARLMSGLGTSNPVFLLGEPVTTEAEAVTLVSVKPETKVSTVSVPPDSYRFTFKVVRQSITYTKASADLIQIDTPQPGAVTGQRFEVRGRARGSWYFEASFPIDVLDANGTKLTTVVAQAQGEWMTTEFVPFIAPVNVGTYSGAATLVLHKDNPSGLPENDASIAYPITIEF